MTTTSSLGVAPGVVSTETNTLVDEPTFADLGVATDLCRLLEAEGKLTPFPIQQLTIPDALAGRDICGKAKTGSGKTIAFGIPLIERTNRAASRRPESLVLVPTRELAVQVTRELRALGVPRRCRVGAVYGGAAMGKQIDELRAGVDILVATPGRLIDLMDRRHVFVSGVKHLVLDEADQMADMGFLPQVDRILRDIDRGAQTMLFSATLDGMVGNLARLHLHDPVHHEVSSDTVTVEEMEHRFFQVHNMDKARVATRICRSVGRSLIFVRTKHGADRLVRDLRAEGVTVAGLHGGKHQKRRETILRDFCSGKTPVLVATDVAARGLHIDAIDVVIHFDPPEDHKSYLHRSGRTARAGETGVVVTLAFWDQVHSVKRLQRRVGISQPIAEIFSSDERLDDIRAWNPAAEVVRQPKQSAGARRRAMRKGTRGRRF